jgi:hypothetical protein
VAARRGQVLSLCSGPGAADSEVSCQRLLREEGSQRQHLRVIRRLLGTVALGVAVSPQSSGESALGAARHWINPCACHAVGFVG